jgi:alkylation response protein AidB-like acyl-CoA dehydrogenase
MAFQPAILHRAPKHPDDALRSLVVSADAHRDEIERSRRLPPGIVDELATSGLLRMCVPRRYGGDEVDPIRFVEVVEQLARADGAVAWCLWIYASAPWFLAYAPDEAVRSVYAGGPDVLVASPLTASGEAVPAPGGYRLSGRWPFASGSRHCQWLVCRGVITEAGSRPTRLFLVPAESVELVDTWTSSGLCGTGSGDVVVRDLFVPAGHCIEFGFGPPRWPEPLYAFPHRSLAAGSAAIALGVARAALDHFTAFAQGKIPAGGGPRLAERPTVQAKVSRSEAQLRAARAVLYDEMGSLWDAVLSGGALPDRQRALLRAAANHACTSAAAVVDTVYRAAGGTSVYASSPLHRHFRDIHTVTQHFFHSEDIDIISGAVLLGVTHDQLARL